MEEMELSTFYSMLTTVTERPIRKSPIQYKIASIIFKYYAPIQLTIALFGNLMIMIIFSRKSMRESVTSFLFRILAIADTFMVLVTLVPEAILEIGGSTEPYSSDLRCGAQGYLYFAGKSFAVWVLVLIVTERFIGINFPHRASSLITKQRARIAVGCLIVVIYSLYAFIPVVMEVSVVRDDDGNILNQFCGIPDDTTIAHFINDIWPTYDMCIYSLIPFIFMLIANISIIYRLAQARRMRSQTAGSDSGDVSGMTAMLLGISFAFVACTLPYNISFFERSINRLGSPNSYLFWACSVVLANMNHCINFYIYCLTGTKFRNEIREMLGCGGKTQNKRLPPTAKAKAQENA